MTSVSIPVETAFSCDEVLNILDDAAEADEVLDDPRAPWQALMWRVAHATWVPGYLRASDRQRLDALLAEMRPQVRWRPFARSGDLIEAASPGVLSDLRARYEKEQMDFAELVERQGQETMVRYHGCVPLSDDLFVAIAREGLFDWIVRSSQSTFELRRCAQDGKWFIPMRAGRGRFCGDSCRARFNSRSKARPRPQAREYNQVCFLCCTEKPRDQFSGLSLFEQGVPPLDLEMKALYAAYNPVCIDCVIEHRSPWARYVTGFAPTSAFEASTR
jgi:hypothetical protein